MVTEQRRVRARTRLGDGEGHRVHLGCGATNPCMPGLKLARPESAMRFWSRPPNWPMFCSSVSTLNLFKLQDADSLRSNKSNTSDPAQHMTGAFLGDHVGPKIFYTKTHLGSSWAPLTRNPSLQRVATLGWQSKGRISTYCCAHQNVAHIVRYISRSKCLRNLQETTNINKYILYVSLRLVVPTCDRPFFNQLPHFKFLRSLW